MTSLPSIMMSTLSDATVPSAASWPAPSSAPSRRCALAIDATSASLSLTVQVARSGMPSSENIVYFVESDSITHWNFGRPSSPHVDDAAVRPALVSSSASGFAHRRELLERRRPRRDVDRRRCRLVAVEQQLDRHRAALGAGELELECRGRLPVSPVLFAWLVLLPRHRLVDLELLGVVLRARRRRPRFVEAADRETWLSLACSELLIGTAPRYVRVRCPSSTRIWR